MVVVTINWSLVATTIDEYERDHVLFYYFARTNDDQTKRLECKIFLVVEKKERKKNNNRF